VVGFILARWEAIALVPEMMSPYAVSKNGKVKVGCLEARVLSCLAFAMLVSTTVRLLFARYPTA